MFKPGFLFLVLKASHSNPILLLEVPPYALLSLQLSPPLCSNFPSVLSHLLFTAVSLVCF